MAPQEPSVINASNSVSFMSRALCYYASSLFTQAGFVEVYFGVVLLVWEYKCDSLVVLVLGFRILGCFCIVYFYN